MAEYTDTERLDFIEANPEKSLRNDGRGHPGARKYRWCFIGMTNYSFRVFPTVREAIDHAMEGYPE